MKKVLSFIMLTVALQSLQQASAQGLMENLNTLKDKLTDLSRSLKQKEITTKEREFTIFDPKKINTLGIMVTNLEPSELKKLLAKIYGTLQNSYKRMDDFYNSLKGYSRKIATAPDEQTKLKLINTIKKEYANTKSQELIDELIKLKNYPQDQVNENEKNIVGKLISTVELIKQSFFNILKNESYSDFYKNSSQIVKSEYDTIVEEAENSYKVFAGFAEEFKKTWNIKSGWFSWLFQK